MSDATKPNFVRYQRVAAVIATEPILESRMSGKTGVVLKPNGDKVDFAVEVIDVTERIHSSGQDANALSKDKIVQSAISVILHGNNGSPAAPKPAVTTEPAVVKAQKRQRRDPVPAVEEKKVARKRRQKEEAPPTAEKPAEIVAPIAEVKKVAAEQPKRPKAAPDVSTGVTIPSPPAQAQGSPVPFAVGCAAISNLIAASQLIEVHDRTLEGKEIRERLDKIIEEVQRRTVIPSGVRG